MHPRLNENTSTVPGSWAINTQLTSPNAISRNLSTALKLKTGRGDDNHRRLPRRTVNCVKAAVAAAVRANAETTLFNCSMANNQGAGTEIFLRLLCGPEAGAGDRAGP
jgi:hypothetical protein